MAAEVFKGREKASELNFEVIEGSSFLRKPKVAEDLRDHIPGGPLQECKRIIH